MTPDECPNCGVDLQAMARACPECGACPDTGWAEEAQYESTQLPEDDFDYDEFVSREFGQGGRPPGNQLHWVWAVFHILIITLQAFIFSVLTIVYLAQAYEVDEH